MISGRAGGSAATTGDAFAGAFLAQLLQKRPVEDCVHAAHWAARLVIQRSGVALPEECDYA